MDGGIRGKVALFENKQVLSAGLTPKVKSSEFRQDAFTHLATQPSRAEHKNFGRKSVPNAIFVPPPVLPRRNKISLNLELTKERGCARNSDGNPYRESRGHFNYNEKRPYRKNGRGINDYREKSVLRDQEVDFYRSSPERPYHYEERGHYDNLPTSNFSNLPLGYYRREAAVNGGGHVSASKLLENGDTWRRSLSMGSIFDETEKQSNWQPHGYADLSPDLVERVYATCIMNESAQSYPKIPVSPTVVKGIGPSLFNGNGQQFGYDRNALDSEYELPGHQSSTRAEKLSFLTHVPLRGPMTEQSIYAPPRSQYVTNPYRESYDFQHRLHNSRSSSSQTYEQSRVRKFSSSESYKDPLYSAEERESCISGTRSVHYNKPLNVNRLSMSDPDIVSHFNNAANGQVHVPCLCDECCLQSPEANNYARGRLPNPRADPSRSRAKPCESVNYRLGDSYADMCLLRPLSYDPRVIHHDRLSPRDKRCKNNNAPRSSSECDVLTPGRRRVSFSTSESSSRPESVRDRSDRGRRSSKTKSVKDSLSTSLQNLSARFGFRSPTKNLSSSIERDLRKSSESFLTDSSNSAYDVQEFGHQVSAISYAEKIKRGSLGATNNFRNGYLHIPQKQRSVSTGSSTSSGSYIIPSPRNFIPNPPSHLQGHWTTSKDSEMIASPRTAYKSAYETRQARYLQANRPPKSVFNYPLSAVLTSVPQDDFSVRSSVSHRSDSSTHFSSSSFDKPVAVSTQRSSNERGTRRRSVPILDAPKHRKSEGSHHVSSRNKSHVTNERYAKQTIAHGDINDIGIPLPPSRSENNFKNPSSDNTGRNVDKQIRSSPSDHSSLGIPDTKLPKASFRKNETEEKDFCDADDLRAAYARFYVESNLLSGKQPNTNHKNAEVIGRAYLKSQSASPPANFNITPASGFSSSKQPKIMHKPANFMPANSVTTDKQTSHCNDQNVEISVLKSNSKGVTAFSATRKLSMPQPRDHLEGVEQRRVAVSCYEKTAINTRPQVLSSSSTDVSEKLCGRKRSLPALMAGSNSKLPTFDKPEKVEELRSSRTPIHHDPKSPCDGTCKNDVHNFSCKRSSSLIVNFNSDTNLADLDSTLVIDSTDDLSGDGLTDNLSVASTSHSSCGLRGSEIFYVPSSGASSANDRLMTENLTDEQILKSPWSSEKGEDSFRSSRASVKRKTSAVSKVKNPIELSTDGTTRVGASTFYLVRAGGKNNPGTYEQDRLPTVPKKSRKISEQSSPTLSNSSHSSPFPTFGSETSGFHPSNNKLADIKDVSTEEPKNLCGRIDGNLPDVLGSVKLNNLKSEESFKCYEHSISDTCRNRIDAKENIAPLPSPRLISPKSPNVLLSKNGFSDTNDSPQRASVFQESEKLKTPSSKPSPVRLKTPGLISRFMNRLSSPGRPREPSIDSESHEILSDVKEDDEDINSRLRRFKSVDDLDSSSQATASHVPKAKTLPYVAGNHTSKSKPNKQQGIDQKQGAAKPSKGEKYSMSWKKAHNKLRKRQTTWFGSLDSSLQQNELKKPPSSDIPLTAQSLPGRKSRLSKVHSNRRRSSKKSLPPLKPQIGNTNGNKRRSIYRRGARRWRKLYKVNGHIYQAKRFNRRASCAFCQDRIWGLGRQGFKCTQCKLLVHKKCSKLQTRPCNDHHFDTSTDTVLSNDSVSAPPASDRSGSTAHGRHRSSVASSIAGGNSAARASVTGDPAALVATAAAEQQDINKAEVTEEAAVEMPPGEPMTPSPSSAGQYSLADFELLRVIGRGSYAKVLMVELKRTGRIYAMKVIKKTLVTDDEDIDWVQTEKHVFETASNHPFLVGLHSCFQTPSRLFFVIEFVRGGDLMFHMQRQRRLHEEHARFYAAEICLALNFLHEKGIIYRDLKLDNVLLDHEGHIKLTDYGMCKEGIRPGDTTSTFCGTPNYIAPEILQGVEYSFSVDWWALGVLLYEMLAGKSPFDIVGASDNPDFNTEDYLFQVILERPIRIPRSLSVKAASILKGFLNKNPSDRLGCHPETGFQDIISHPFFRTIDWEMLEQRLVPPPHRPRLEGDRDLANFPPEFTDEPIQLTPDQQRDIDNIDQSEFEGFEYVNPLLMSMEDCV